MTPPEGVPRPIEDDEAIPPTPGEDETVIVVEKPDITISTEKEKRRKVYVDGVRATVIAERVEYLDENGKLITGVCVILRKKR